MNVSANGHHGSVDAEYAHAGMVRRAVRLLVTTRPVAFLSARYLPEVDRVVNRMTRGRITPSALLTGLPVIELSTLGARSGQRRAVRLLGIPDADGYLVVAANFGGSANPAWYHNVRAHPRVVVTDGETSGEYLAIELEGDERAAGFERALSLNPGWTRFRDRAGAREIPVLRLIAADVQQI